MTQTEWSGAVPWLLLLGIVLILVRCWLGRYWDNVGHENNKRRWARDARKYPFLRPLWEKYKNNDRFLRSKRRSRKPPLRRKPLRGTTRW